MDDVSGSYTGNGTTQNVVLGFVPTSVLLTNTKTGMTCIWEDHLADDTMYSQESGDDVVIESEGVTPTEDGFSVGSYHVINDNGVGISYFAEDTTE